MSLDSTVVVKIIEKVKSKYNGNILSIILNRPVSFTDCINTTIYKPNGNTIEFKGSETEHFSLNTNNQYKYSIKNGVLIEEEKIFVPKVTVQNSDFLKLVQNVRYSSQFYEYNNNLNFSSYSTNIGITDWYAKMTVFNNKILLSDFTISGSFTTTKYQFTIEFDFDFKVLTCSQNPSLENVDLFGKNKSKISDDKKFLIALNGNLT